MLNFNSIWTEHRLLLKVCGLGLRNGCWRHGLWLELMDSNISLETMNLLHHCSAQSFRSDDEQWELQGQQKQTVQITKTNFTICGKTVSRPDYEHSVPCRDWNPGIPKSKTVTKSRNLGFGKWSRDCNPWRQVLALKDNQQVLNHFLPFKLLNNDRYNQSIMDWHLALEIQNTLGTAAWKLKFFIGVKFVLIVDTAITWTSGRGRSFPKCSRIFIPFLSYPTTGANKPECNTAS